MTAPTFARWALLALLVTAASCAFLQNPEPAMAPRPRLWARADEGGGPSYAIYPTQRIPLRFDHARHLRIPGVTCTPCHDPAVRSARASDRLVPSESACTPCHAIDRDQPLKLASPSARCDACHEGFDPAQPFRIARVVYPPNNVIFSHAAHLARGETCVQCHGTMQDVSLATRLELPTMQRCFECHHDNGGSASSACNECHLTREDGRLRTDFAEGAMNPPAWMTGLHHDADFWVTHRYVAADDGARCATCHTESDCVECHDGRVRDRRTHPADYTSMHAAEARQSPEHCTSCHRTTSFCTTCHLRIGVAEDSTTSASALGRFHPPADEWSGRVVGPRHHAMEARRSLGACVSCHTERDCIACHADAALGGGGIDPHPPGFERRCAILLHASSRPCAQCHEDLGVLEARCR